MAISAVIDAVAPSRPVVPAFEMTDRDLAEIVRRVRRASGIVLGEAKRDLVYGRLVRRVRALRLPSFAAYLDLLDDPAHAAEHIALVNAITTNLTRFFRESHHFEALERDAIPEWAAAPAPARRLRIWSAGCSSGEEPYSIAMTLRQGLRDLDSWDAAILATDIDTNMIATCEAGEYDAAKAASIPPDLRKNFARPSGRGTVTMDDRLKSLIRFKPLNLLEEWPMQGLFDAIFCRNVVIYFDEDTQRALFNRFADRLRPNGWLFIGNSESLARVSTRFRGLGQTIYRKIR